MNEQKALRVRRAIFLTAGGAAVFLSYLAVISGTAPNADLGPVSIAAIAFPALVTAFVMVSYIAWETNNVRMAEQHAEKLNAELMRKEIEIGRFGTVDELTRLHTAKAFESAVRLEFERRRRYGRDLSLMLLDIEHVGGLAPGKMNKSYLLTELGAICRNILRANDIGGRVGGDRLGLLLPETDDIRAQLVADRIREAIARHEFLGLLRDGGVRVSLGVGIALGDDEMTTHQDLFKAAEEALGEALALGANQVRVFERRRNDDAPPAGPFRLAS